MLSPRAGCSRGRNFLFRQLLLFLPTHSQLWGFPPAPSPPPDPRVRGAGSALPCAPPSARSRRPPSPPPFRVGPAPQPRQPPRTCSAPRPLPRAEPAPPRPPCGGRTKVCDSARRPSGLWAAPHPTGTHPPSSPPPAPPSGRFTTRVKAAPQRHSGPNLGLGGRSGGVRGGGGTEQGTAARRVGQGAEPPPPTPGPAAGSGAAPRGGGTGAGGRASGSRRYLALVQSL